MLNEEVIPTDVVVAPEDEVLVIRKKDLIPGANIDENIDQEEEEEVDDVFDDSYFEQWSEDDSDLPDTRCYLPDVNMAPSFFYVRMYIKEEIQRLKKLYDLERQKIKEEENRKEKEKEEEKPNIIEKTEKNQNVIGGGEKIGMNHEQYKHVNTFKFKANKFYSKDAENKRNENEKKKESLAKMTEEQKKELEVKKLLEKIMDLEARKHSLSLIKKEHEDFVNKFEKDFGEYHQFYEQETYDDYVISIYAIKKCQKEMKELDEKINKLWEEYCNKKILISKKEKIIKDDKQSPNRDKNISFSSNSTFSSSSSSTNNSTTSTSTNSSGNTNTNVKTNTDIIYTADKQTREEKDYAEYLVELTKKSASFCDVIPKIEIKKENKKEVKEPKKSGWEILESLCTKQEEIVKRKNRMCRSYLYGKNCTRENCEFSHTIEELEPDMCLNGENCQNKKECLYMHGKETKNDLIVRLNLDKRQQVTIKPTVVKKDNEDTKTFWSKMNPPVEKKEIQKETQKVGNTKTLMCRKFLLGNCTYKECTFAHSYEELTPAICSFDARCKFGKDCKFLHPSVEKKESYLKRIGLESIIPKKNNEYKVVVKSGRPVVQTKNGSFDKAYKYGMSVGLANFEVEIMN